MTSGQDKALLLDRRHTGSRTALPGRSACTHLDEHQGAIGIAKNQVDFTATATRRPIIALKQTQAGSLQVIQGQILGSTTTVRRAADAKPIHPAHACPFFLTPPMSSPSMLHRADFGSALPAAQDAAGSQHYPAGKLYVVATPIGNLADITLRALHVLQLVDVIACEDTRHTRQLLQRYGVDSKPLIAMHEHNEMRASAVVLEHLHNNQRVAFVSDAGTPAVSDPGARLVAACVAAGLGVMPLPGASSVTTALSVAGLGGDGRFVFEGFLSTRRAERQASVATLARESRAVVLLEAPHRITALADALTALAAREITVARELTKQFEQVATMACRDLPAWLAQDDDHRRGEFVLVLHPDPDVDSSSMDEAQLLSTLLTELPLKTAVRLAAKLSGAPRNRLYEQALSMKNQPAS